MTNKLPSFFKGGNPQRGQSGKDHLPESSSQFFLDESPHPTISTIITGLCLTFLKTIGSSSHTGLMALLFWEVLVFSAFLLVSAGSPNISTSMYTPTRRSVRNWPEITWKHRYKEFHFQSGSTENKHWQIKWILSNQFPFRYWLYTIYYWWMVYWLHTIYFNHNCL